MPQSPSYTSVEGASAIGVVLARSRAELRASFRRAARGFTVLHGGGCARPRRGAAWAANAIALPHQAARSISGFHLPSRARLFIMMRRDNACCAADVFSARPAQ